MRKLKFQKMWEAADLHVFDIDTGSVLPIVKTLPQVASFADSHWFFHFKNGVGGAYYETEDMCHAAENGLKDFLDISYREKYFQGVSLILEREASISSQIENLNLSAIALDELRNLFQSSVDAVVENFGYYLASQPQCVSLIEEQMQIRLGELFSKEVATEAFLILSTPTKPTKITRESKEWWKLVQNTKNKSVEDVSSLVENHYKKYFLLNAADGQSPWTRDYFSAKLTHDSQLSLEEVEKEIMSIERKEKDQERIREEFIQKHSIPEDVRRYGDILSEIGHWRLEMRFEWMAGYYYNKILLAEITKRFDIDSRIARFATIAEIQNLFNGKELDIDLLTERGMGFLFLVEDGTVRVLSGAEAEKRFNEYIPETDKSISELKGNIAMKGKVQGPALVFKWGDNMQERLDNAPENFILVAGQTRPQLMPLIIKSQGIITDEGGITSHAAIVAREIGKPCIIGTKMATEILKNGDEVLLDADKGVIKILDKV